jgi:hypothetical protein
MSFRFAILALGMFVTVQAHALTTGYVYAHYDNATPSSIISYSMDGGPWTSVYAGVYNLHIHATNYGDYTSAGEATRLMESLSSTQFHHGGGVQAVSAMTFCIDINQLAPQNNDWNFYEIRTLDAAPGGAPGTLTMTDQAMMDITKLWVNYRGLLDTGTMAERNFAAGVFQTCIWEIINERSGDYDLLGGAFVINNLGIATTGNAWLSSLSSLPDVDPSELQLRALYSDVYQDFAIVMPIAVGAGSAVPEPMTMFSMGMAIFGAGAYLRKRKLAARNG